jgi:shikimate kinase
MRVYLIGMPGSGKTTLGKRLAKLLQFTFVDMDVLITEQEQMPVSDVFKIKGEAYFRTLESQVLLHTTALTQVVIATGGGTPCFFDNMDVMNAAGVTVFLDVSVGTLALRVGGNSHTQSTRPLFAGKSEPELLDALNNMRQLRLPFYTQAQVNVAEAELNADQVYQKIKRFTE